MRWLVLAIALAGYVLCVPAGFATGHAIQPIHPEREHMSAAARRNAVLDDLNALLVGPAAPTKIATTPYAASDGLCQRDVISLAYRQTRHGDRAIKFVPVGIASVTKQYHLIGQGNETSEKNAEQACRTLDGVEDYWAESESETTARFGLPKLRDVAAQLRRKDPASIDCKPPDDAVSAAACAAEFLTVADRPTYVSNCAEPARASKQDCFVYGLGAYDVTIIWDWTGLSGTHPKITIRLEPRSIIV